MFYYAKQTPSDYVDTTSEIDYVLKGMDAPVIVFGNRDYTGFNQDELSDLEEFFYDALDDFDLALDNYMSFFNGNDAKVLALKELFKDFDEHTSYTDEIAAKLLTIKYGVKYELHCIRGYCQGDWQYVLAPEDLDFKYFEALYFGTVTEYAVSTEKLASPEDFEDADHFYCFVVDDLEDAMRKDLANQIGCKLEELKIANITNSYTCVHYDYSDFN